LPQRRAGVRRSSGQTKSWSNQCCVASLRRAGVPCPSTGVFGMLSRPGCGSGLARARTTPPTPHVPEPPPPKSHRARSRARAHPISKSHASANRQQAHAQQAAPHRSPATHATPEPATSHSTKTQPPPTNDLQHDLLDARGVPREALHPLLVRGAGGGRRQLGTMRPRARASSCALPLNEDQPSARASCQTNRRSRDASASGVQPIGVANAYGQAFE
jgi:hypothetical protein